jgi:hypothetical protein
MTKSLATLHVAVRKFERVTMSLKRKADDLDHDQGNNEPFSQSFAPQLALCLKSPRSGGQKTLCRRCASIEFDKVLSKNMRGTWIQFILMGGP